MQEFDRVETPENVELERRLAGIGSRFLAGLTDNLILLGIYILLVLAFLGLAWVGGMGFRRVVESIGTWAIALLIAVIFLVYWGYFVFFEMATNGQSPGKRRLKIRVVKIDGGPITFTDIAIRNLLRPIDGLGGYVLAGIVMFVTERVQRLGDLAAGTVVISEQMPDYASASTSRIVSQWDQQISAEALRATGLNPEEYRLLHHYWVRRHLLKFDARERLLQNLVRPILKRLGRSAPADSLEGYETAVFRLLGEAAGVDAKAAKSGSATPGEGP